MVSDEEMDKGRRRMSAEDASLRLFKSGLSKDVPLLLQKE
jgi:hypothetical protein